MYTWMWEYWYSGVLVRMNAGALVLGCEYWYSGLLVRTNAGVLVLGWEYWYSLPIFLTYVEVDVLSWGGWCHSDSRENSLLALLENNHRNKVFLDRTGVIIRTNTIGALLHQCADYYSGVPVRKLLPRCTSTLLSWHYWLTSTPECITVVCKYEGINMLIITLVYQYACFYSGVLVVCTIPF
jgi:hypothetical protein